MPRRTELRDNPSLIFCTPRKRQGVISQSMKTTEKVFANSHVRPVLTGLFAVLLTLFVGISIAFITGLTTPSQVLAQVGPPCCVPPPPPPPPPPLPPPPPPPPPLPPVVIPPPVKPVVSCDLSIKPSSVQPGSRATLVWNTRNADTFTIDNGVGSMALVETGSAGTPPITSDTTFTGTATGPHGSAKCIAKVKIITTKPLPVCTLTASKSTIELGGSSVLSWTTSNATAFTVDNGVGTVANFEAGSTTVSPLVTTTYTGRATGPGGTSAPCKTTITVTKPPSETLSCELKATPTAIQKGRTSVLTWTTNNASKFVINNGVGEMALVETGSAGTPAITSDITFTGTATSKTGKTVTCSAKVTVTDTPPPSALACTLSASPNSLPVGGGTVSLSWTTDDAVSFSIDNGIGSKTPVASGSVTSPTITSDTTFVGTATDKTGKTVSCSVPVTVATGGGGGGGGGGGSSRPKVVLSAVPHTGTVAGSYIYLSQVPYTGLDLGPFGTAIYWVALIGWSLALAYLVLFGVVPFAGTRMRTFGERVSLALTTNAVTSTNASQAPAFSYSAAHIPETQEASRGYSTFDGFKSFAKNEALSIEDIVKGLARNHTLTPEPKSERANTNSEPIYDHVEPVYENVEAIEETGATNGNVQTDVRGFTISLVQGDRTAVFASLRQQMRGAGAPEQLLSSAVCLLDDVYRARIDGTPCDEEIARVTARLTTPVLEKLIASLTTAIDSSYSTGVTGAKLALTRALSTLGA